MLAGVLSGMASHLLVLPTYPLGFLPRREKTGSGPPVLLVHGLYHNRSAWLLMAPRLRRLGFSNLHPAQYPSFGRDFWAILEGLVQQALALLQAGPGRKIGLVGHSLGGLLVRAAAADPRLAGRVFAVVTLGAPHRGSRLAALGIGSLARSLVFEGPLVRRIEALGCPAGIPKLSLSTVADDFVTPLAAMRVEGPGWLEVEGPAVSHVSLLYSRRTASLVGEFLARSGGGNLSPGLP